MEKFLTITSDPSHRPKTDPRQGGAEKAARQKFHCALMQKGTAIEDMILRSIKGYEVVVHKFDSIEQLYVHSQRVMIEMIIVASHGSADWMLELLPKIKRDSTLQFIPIVFYHPDPHKEMVVKAYRQGVDEVVTSSWDYQIMGVKMEMLLARSRRDLGVNPTTKLPGPAAIEQEIAARLKSCENVAVCYADLDDFKAYNDYHGYVYGDKIILMVSRILRDTVHDLVNNGFVGHVGGDDFVFLIPYDKVDIVCKNIIDIFDKMIPFRYQEADRERGYIEVADRRGQMDRFPIMTISIAVLPCQAQNFTHVGEMSHMIADLKKYTKTLPGSNYMIERRKKY